MTTQVPQHDTRAAINFLEAWSPDSAWVLTAIVPDGTTETKTFQPIEWVEASEWIESRQGRKGLYFHVNETTQALAKDKQGRAYEVKASKEHVRRLRALHVDIDPRVGEDFEDERQRALKLLQTAAVKPTVIVDSGGGYQGFWLLLPDERLAINGDPIKAAELERYNIQLEKVFGADHCHNCDRIMRLPGTVNIPNAKKRQKGRVPTVAKLVEWNDEAVYPIAAFTAAPLVNENMPAATGKPRPRLRLGEATGSSADWPSGRAAPFGTDDLQRWAQDNGKVIADSTLALINVGTDPVDPSKYGSRSEPQFKVCCDLVRAGVRDEIHFRIITDPSNKVSACVLDKPSWEKYARDQIEKAHETVGEPAPVLHPGSPLASAREFVAREQPHLLHYNGDWLSYADAAYGDVEEGTMRRDLYAFLERAVIPSDDDPAKGRPFNPTREKVSNVLDALKGAAHVARGLHTPPCWLDGDGPPPHELVACRNGLLHLPSGELYDNSPRFFTRNALPFDYSADAPPPDQWTAFLDSLWPDEPEAINVLQEMFGYLLVPDTSQQKVFLLVGPTRSGKGTIARVLMELVGPPNVCAPTLASMGGDFGLEPLLGKQLAILGDVRLDGRANHTAITANLLSISGEDLQTVNRKNKSHWNGRLAVRFLLLTNYIPKFSGDNSDALPNRFVPLIMTRSFLGAEDLGLLSRLLAERPSILNWAIEGWRRLKARGYFDLPESSRAAIRELFEAGSPVASFMRDECALDSESEEPKDDLFLRWKAWCIDNERPHPGNKDWFCGQLKAAANLVTITPRAPGTNGRVRRVAKFRGIRLLDEQEKAGGDDEPEQGAIPLGRDDGCPF